MGVRIYSPAKNAMQSGQRNSNCWILEYPRINDRRFDPLMGYLSSGDMLSQVKLVFSTLAEAENYAKRHGLVYRVELKPLRKRGVQSYSDNFSFKRPIPWTH